jgi:hypothetical protein
MGPFGIPTDREEFVRFLVTTGLTTAFWSLHHALDVWHTIPRMASHHYANPSRSAIVRAARSQSTRMSFLRFAGLTRMGGPLALVYAMTAVEDIVGDPIDRPSDVDRIMRARSISSGNYYTGTHMFGLSEPYYERSDGERIYYSFHPEWID